MRVITTDTLGVEGLTVPDSVIESAWMAAVRGGVFQLPGHVARNWIRDDGFTYVIELRRGDDYRASVIEHLERPETDADQQVKQIYAAVNRVLPPGLLPRP